MARGTVRGTARAGRNSSERLAALYLDMLAAERGAGKNTLAAFGRGIPSAQSKGPPGRPDGPSIVVTAAVSGLPDQPRPSVRMASRRRQERTSILRLQVACDRGWRQ